MTLTPAKLTANRRNARKSTGPATLRGRAISKLNALKHGWLAKTVVVRSPQFNESPSELKKLHHEFHLDLQPEGPLEAWLVDQIVQAHWRLRRVRSAEAGEIAVSINQQELDGQPMDLALQWQNWSAHGDPVDAMEKSVRGNAILIGWWKKILACVEQDGGVSEAILKIPCYGRPNRLSEKLKVWQQQRSQPPADADPAAYHSGTKEFLLRNIRIDMHFQEWLKERCAKRETSLAAARQSAALLPPPKTLKKILRYETALERQLYRAMNQLERLQRRRLGESIPAPLALNM
jgi:hypothetical protein